MCPVGPGLARIAAALRLVPFISQTETAPLLFCHRTSDLPSWLKSPVPTMCQSGSGLRMLPPPIGLVPFRRWGSQGPAEWQIGHSSAGTTLR